VGGAVVPKSGVLLNLEIGIWLKLVKISELSEGCLKTPNPVGTGAV
jgi:hypothetical protein